MNVADSKLILIECLRLIASPADTQISSVPDFADTSFEVLNAFTESFMQLPGMVEAEAIHYPAIAAILRCYNWVNYISRQESLLHVEAMQQHGSWEKARVLALRALAAMGEEYRSPNLEHISFAEG